LKKCLKNSTIQPIYDYSMSNRTKLWLGAFLLLTSGIFMGSFLQKAETKLNVIKAGLDDKGNLVCVNKSQVFLFKKLNGENKIVFHYHDALSKEAMVTKSFPDAKTLDTYWDQLLRNW